MTTRPVRAIAAEVGRRVRARRRDHSLGAAVRPAPAERPVEDRADGAELDALRGALVRELDRLAAADEGSSSFRRA